MTAATDIVAYTYNTETLCPGCAAEAVRFTGSPFTGLTVEQFLDMVADHRGINRHDERSFDSSDFPKVVFASQIDTYDDEFFRDDERCDRCDVALA